MSAQRRTVVEEESAPLTRTPAVQKGRGREPKRPAGSGGRGGEVAKPSLLATRTASLRAYLQETMAEIRKVTWPDQETTRNLTVVVIGISIVFGILLGGIDFLLVRLLGLF